MITVTQQIREISCLRLRPSIPLTLNIRVFDEKNQSPQQCCGSRLSSCKEQIQRAQSQVGLCEAQVSLFVLFREAEWINS